MSESNGTRGYAHHAISTLWVLAMTLVAAPALGDEPAAGTTAAKTSVEQKLTSPAPVKPYELDSKQPAEDQWRDYLKAATKNYELTAEQSKAATAVLTSCLKRASERRAAMADGGSPKEAGASKVNYSDPRRGKAGAADATDITVALNHLTDEFVFRVDAIARLDQVQKAEQNGFVSPRKPVSVQKPDVGVMAPDFTLKGEDGKEVSMAGLHGKVVVVTFWASWCGWCKKSLPDIQKLNDEFNGKNVALLCVNCREKDAGNAMAKKIIQDSKYTFPVVYGGDAVSAMYDVQGFPTLYVVGPDGKILYKQRGYKDNVANVIRPIIQGALKPS